MLNPYTMVSDEDEDLADVILGHVEEYDPTPFEYGPEVDYGPDNLPKFESRAIDAGERENAADDPSSLFLRWSSSEPFAVVLCALITHGSLSVLLAGDSYTMASVVAPRRRLP